LSRDEGTQRAGAVVIGYSMFTDASRKSPPTPSDKKCKEIGIGDREIDTGVNEELIEPYLKQTYPLLSQLIRVGMSAQLRGASMHMCIDHPKLNLQFEKMAGFMSTTSAARFRCHYASPQNPELSILGSPRLGRKGQSNGNSPTFNSGTVNRKYNISNINRETETDSQQDNESDTAIDYEINPYKELLYTLMTFGIPREAIPINDATGELYLDTHQAILEAIEEREDQDRVDEEKIASASSPSACTSLSSYRVVPEKQPSERMTSLSSSNGSDKLWMSLTASIGSTSSFALFHSLIDDEGLDGGSNHSTNSLFGPTPKIVSKKETDSPLPDLIPSLSAPEELLSTDNVRSSSNPTAKSEAPKLSKAPPSSSADPTHVPAPNDVIMGRGPWNRNHPGNLRLKSMLERERERYEYVNRFERMRIVDSMLNELYHDFGARFLFKPRAKAPGASNRSPHSNTSGDVWCEAKRDKAHDKITHDFRNLRRQKNVSPKPTPVNNPPLSGYNV